jgi:hypothetical protein
MVPALRWVLFVYFLFAQGYNARAQYSVKSVKAEPPPEVDNSLSKLVNDESIQFLDAKGTVLCQLWFAKAVPSEATPEQAKNGLTYRELKETSFLGIARFDQPWTDYRKQRIKAGVYTLRLGFQPMDGDHMGTSPHSEFCMLVSAKKDTKPGTLESKSLVEMSTASMGTSHPGVLMLFPNNKPAPMPQLVDKGNNHWALNTQVGVAIQGQPNPAVIGIGLTLVGNAD